MILMPLLSTAERHPDMTAPSNCQAGSTTAAGRPTAKHLSPAILQTHRAIILFLARMALRAGDIWHLRLSDVDWCASRLRLQRKTDVGP